MSTITLRATKGSPLTNTEVDSNFSNLNADKLEATYAGAMNSLTGGTSIATVGTITAGTWNATIISPTYGGTGVNNGTKTITLGGNLTTSGAFATTLTVTGATNVTLPTSGTLATTTGTMAAGATWNGNVIGAAYGGTGVANNAANTITFTGNFSLGLTLSGATSVTLPTSGTLATLAGTEALTNKTINGLTITSSTGTLTVAAAKTLTASNTLTLTGTDGSSVAFGTGGTVAYTNVATLSSLASVGTITTGTWQATDIGLAYGGTNATLTASAGSIVYSTASAMAFSGVGASGQFLQSNGTSAPTWVTPTYASTGKAIAMAMVFGG